MPRSNPPARRAVVMVWDGMRPDLISAELTPNLVRLAADGARMLDSHAVFPTVTRVNSASLATGMLPAVHGIVGNSLYAPLVDPRASISIGDHRSLYALIETRGGRLLPCDTLADQVGRLGGRTVVVSSGSPGSAFLCHPRVRETTNHRDRMFHPALMWPESLQDELVARLGPIPEGSIPDSALSVYFNRIVTELVLPELDPTLLLYWHADPDKTEHHRGFGSPEALEAIRDADRHLGTLLAAIETNGGLAETVLAVVSDHGYVTVDPKLGMPAPFLAAGLGPELEAGRLIFSGNGCTFFVNVAGDDPALVERVALALQAWPQAGAIFSGARGRPPVDGTLPLSLVGLDGELAPDVLCALAWDDTPNQYGHGGRGGSIDPVYQATHGGLSHWEVRNTFVLAGAGIKPGFENPLPSGNIDLAPTIQHLLGLEPPAGQHGRVLHEALADGPDPATITVNRKTVRAQRGAYRQSIQLSQAAGTTYLDFGNSERS